MFARNRLFATLAASAASFGVAELLLRPLPHGDVVEDGNAVVQHALLVFEGRGIHTQPGAAVVASVGDVHLRALDFLSANGLCQRKALERIRRHPVRQQQLLPSEPQLTGVVPRVGDRQLQQPLGGRVGENQPALIVGDDDSVAHAVENRLQDPLLPLERTLGAGQFPRALLGGRAAFGDAALERHVEGFQFVLRTQAFCRLFLELCGPLR